MGFETGLEEIEMGKNWMETVLLVERGGLSPIEALRASTYNAVMAIGINAGVIEIGKDADIIIINGDPTQNVREISKITHIIKNGKLTVENKSIKG